MSLWTTGTSWTKYRVGALRDTSQESSSSPRPDLVLPHPGPSGPIGVEQRVTPETCPLTRMSDQDG